MAYVRRHAEYDVVVQGRFIDEKRWFVHGVLQYSVMDGAKPRVGLESEARLELLIGIARESRRGRELGAKDVHVIIEGDKETQGFFELIDAASGLSRRRLAAVPSRLPGRKASRARGDVTEM